METRKFQKKQKYKTERHHIFPKSIYGDNDFLVNLTYKEHYIAHMLLWKMYDLNSLEFKKMVYAFETMCRIQRDDSYVIKKSSRLHAKLRENYRIIHGQNTKDRWDNPEYRYKMTKHWQDYWSDEDNRKTKSAVMKNVYKDPEKYAALVERNREITSKESWRKQRSEKQKELSANTEYTKLRINAMKSPVVIAKSKASNKKRIDAMTDKERKIYFTREKSPEQRKAHADSIRGRKGIIHPVTLIKKVVPKNKIDTFLAEGWVLQTEYTELNKTKNL